MDKNFRDAALAAFKRSAVEAAEKQKAEDIRPADESAPPAPVGDPALMETQAPVELAPEPEPEQPDDAEPESAPQAAAPVVSKGKPMPGKAGRGGAIPAMKRKPGLAPAPAPKPAPAPAPARREAPAPKPVSKPAPAPGVAGTGSFTRSRIAPPAPAKDTSNSLLMLSAGLNAVLLLLVIILLILVGNTMARVGAAEKQISDMQSKTLGKMQADLELVKKFSLVKFGVYEHPMKGLQAVSITYGEDGKNVGAPRVVPIKLGPDQP